MGSYKKKLFIVLLLFLLINFCVCSSVRAATAITEDYIYSIDYIELFQNEQELYANIFFYYLDKTNISDTQRNELKTLFQEKYVYFVFQAGTNQSGWCNIIANFYNKNINYYAYSLNTNLEYEGEHIYVNDPNYLYNVSGYVINCTRRYVQINNNSYFTANDYTVNVPSLLIGYNNQNVNNFLNDVPINMSPWAMLQAAIKDNTDAVEDTTQAVNNLRNDFNEEESDSDYSFPTDNPTQDTSEASIDAVFTLFYDKINAWSSAQMQIPIPFTGKHFNIPPNLTENIINGFPAGNVISRLLGLIWYYLLGVYIIKDVQKYIDGLQTGEILTKSDTNIKTEML